MSLGLKIKHLRSEKKMSQEELGKFVGINAKHISKIENDHLIPHIPIIKKFAEIFLVSIDYLVFENVPKEANLNRFSDPKLVELVFELEKLPENHRETAKNVLEAIITKSKAENLFK